MARTGKIVLWTALAALLAGGSAVVGSVCGPASLVNVLHSLSNREIRRAFCSPIAAYLNQEDLVLVLDVNQKYGPWLVKPDRLYEAMNTVDTTAQKKRGLLLIE